MTPAQARLLGLVQDHLVPIAPGQLLHPAAARAFIRLQRRAAAAGFNLQPASSFRSFERQRQIWCAKYTGQRPILDDHGQPHTIASLGIAEKLAAILRWSALPGTSRHHWGSDLDVYDPDLLPAGYSLQLLPEEYQAGGPLAELADWLLEHQHREGFFLPYRTDLGGVAPEPWHISYRPLAEPLLATLTPVLLEALFARYPLPDQPEISRRLTMILQRYVFNITT